MGMRRASRSGRKRGRGLAVFLILAIHAPVGAGPAREAPSTLSSISSIRAAAGVAPDLAEPCRTGEISIPELGSAEGSTIPCADGPKPPAEEAACLPWLDACATPRRSGGSASGLDALGGSQDSSGTWSVVPTPNPSAAGNVLTAVTCVSPSDCWAVGRSSQFLGRTLTMHWDGDDWAIFPSPTVPNVLANILEDVTCASTSDCWAVGAYATNDLTVRTLVLHWDGQVWSLVSSPNDGPHPWNGLNSVTCVSSSDCWAVGFTTDGVAQTLILRWNGGSWERHLSPNAGVQHNLLHGVTCLTGSDCWAVGSHATDAAGKHTLTLRWDGDRWAIFDSPDALPTNENVLSGVTCTSPADCWAVGTSFTGLSRQTLVEHWDGASWTSVPSPNAVGALDTHLSRVECASASACLAVGHANDGVRDQRFALRWQGAIWVPEPDFGSVTASPNSVAVDAACPAADDCWMVGTLGSRGSLLSRWEGTLWSTYEPPQVVVEEDANGYLDSVDCITPDDCWAVGKYFSASVARTLTMHWDGTSWEIVASPNTARDLNNYLDEVTCTSTSDCWAVGRETTPAGLDWQMLILHWDGSGWSIVTTSPARTGVAEWSALESVSCISASSCWAVGLAEIDEFYPVFMHWNGASWVRLTPGEPTFPGNSDNAFYGKTGQMLFDVSCVETGTCIAAGQQWTGTEYQTLTYHFDGMAWRVVDSPNRREDRNNNLYGVSCASVDDCWAVGRAEGSSDDEILILRWNGISWSLADAPRAHDFLNDVTCASTSDCWAVGRSFGSPGPPPKTITLHWDGSAWTMVDSPNPTPAQGNYLVAVKCASSDECWAVGRYSSSVKTLALRYATAPTTIPVSLAFTPSSSHGGQYSDEVRLEAVLTDAEGVPLAGQEISFELSGDTSARELTAVTDGNGIAATTPILEEKPGLLHLTARYGGDAVYLPAETTTPFVVEREGADLDLSTQGNGVGSNLRLKAFLSDEDVGGGIAGRLIHFYVGDELIGQEVTDEMGAAILDPPTRPRPSKDQPYSARFEGDDYYVSSADEAPWLPWTQ